VIEFMIISKMIDQIFNTSIRLSCCSPQTKTKDEWWMVDLFRQTRKRSPKNKDLERRKRKTRDRKNNRGGRRSRDVSGFVRLFL